MEHGFKYQIIITLIFIFLGFIAHKSNKLIISKFAQKRKIARARQLLIHKLSFFSILILLITILIFVWGIKLTNIWVLTTSVLGVVGIGFFATWSLLSNIFSAFLLFSTVPFKIDDNITIKDGDNSISGVVIDMTLFYIILKNNNNESAVVPNNMIFQKIIIKHNINNISN
jgi:MscS family membrane protein